MAKKKSLAGKPMTRETRKRTATIVEKQNGTVRYRFPMGDAAHARNALARLNQAKGLSQEEKVQIFNRAHSILKSTPEEKKASRKRIFGGK